MELFETKYIDNIPIKNQRKTWKHMILDKSKSGGKIMMQTWIHLNVWYCRNYWYTFYPIPYRKDDDQGPTIKVATQGKNELFSRAS